MGPRPLGSRKGYQIRKSKGKKRERKKEKREKRKKKGKKGPERREGKIEKREVNQHEAGAIQAQAGSQGKKTSRAPN